MGDGKRVLIISPVRNEAEHIERVARSVQRQSRPPDAWLVVDDGSTDGTPGLLREIAAGIPFMRALATPDQFTAGGGDRLRAAADARAFNWGLGSVAWDEFTHIGKLDGDVELPEHYFRTLLAEFDHDPALGIGGGVLVERVGGDWKAMRTARHHVRGALKLYRRECFQAIGGIREVLGWDGMDQTYARMAGWTTRSFDHVVARHHRSCGSADGIVRGRVRGGENHYALGFSFPWVVLKACRYARLRPIGISGAAFLYGYVRSAWRSAPRVEDPEYRRFVRRDERRRLVAAVRR